MAEDIVLEKMKKMGLPMNRGMYLQLAYFGQTPAEWSAEEESMLPEEFQKDE